MKKLVLLFGQIVSENISLIADVGPPTWTQRFCSERFKPKRMTPFFYRTYGILYHKFENMVIFRSRNLYSLSSSVLELVVIINESSLYFWLSNFDCQFRLFFWWKN